MKQAIEEGFILDVLRNYVTYKSYYEITKTVAENPLFDTTRAQRRLRAFVEGHDATIKVKAQIMVDHFIEQLVKPKKLRGRARAMVVTSGIVNAIRYHTAISAYLAASAWFRALIAFSGKKTLMG
jgi:type I restriction enzyme R subunit